MWIQEQQHGHKRKPAARAHERAVGPHQQPKTDKCYPCQEWTPCFLLAYEADLARSAGKDPWPCRWIPALLGTTSPQCSAGLRRTQIQQQGYRYHRHCLWLCLAQWAKHRVLLLACSRSPDGLHRVIGPASERRDGNRSPANVEAPSARAGTHGASVSHPAHAHRATPSCYACRPWLSGVGSIWWFPRGPALRRWVVAARPPTQSRPRECVTSDPPA